DAPRAQGRAAVCLTRAPSPRLELELQLGAEVNGPLEEELAEEQRCPLIVEEHTDPVRAVRRGPFEAPGQARVHVPSRRLHRREVRAEDRPQTRFLEPPPGLQAGTAQLEPPLRECRGGGEV